MSKLHQTPPRSPSISEPDDYINPERLEPDDEDLISGERQVSALPAVDTSRQAWFFVAAGFIVEAVLFGPLISSGVYLKEYAIVEPFSSAPETKISLIGTLSIFFALSGGLPLIYFYNRYPRLIKPSLWVGLVLFCASMTAASFVKSVDGLIFLQGIIPGIAAALCAFPIISWVPDWFDRRRGTALGIIFSGGPVGGAFMPLLNQYLFEAVGIQWTLRITTIYTAILASFAILFAHPRIPISHAYNVVKSPMQPLMKTFWSFKFWGVFLTTLLQGFGYYNVGLFLPRFSDTLGPTQGAILLSAFNVSCIAAQVLWGFLTDRVRPITAMTISSLTGCVLVLTLWGFGGSVGLAVFAPFAIMFGLAAGGFSSMWSQCAHAIAGGPDKEVQTLLVSGFSVARGMGAVIGPTVGSSIYHQATTNLSRWGSAGSPGLISLVATSLACSAAVGVGVAHGPSIIKRLRAWRRRFSNQACRSDTAATEHREHGVAEDLEVVELDQMDTPPRADKPKTKEEEKKEM